MSASDILSAMAADTERHVGLERRLAVAWQNPDSRAIRPVGILTYRDDRYTFCYIKQALSVVGFQPFLGFPDLHAAYQSRFLFPLFSQRVMDPRRPDYMGYIDSLDLQDDADPLEVLARSEGRRAGDTIMIFPEPLVDQDGRTAATFLVHGVRHVPASPDEIENRLASLKRGDPLVLIPEQTNPVNPAAIRVATQHGHALGWVPDLLIDYVRRVERDLGSLRVAQINGIEAPSHMRLLARISGQVEPSYSPFSGDAWELLASRQQVDPRRLH